MTNLSQDVLQSIEADSFWCMSKLLDGIQVSPWVKSWGNQVLWLPWRGTSRHACDPSTQEPCLLGAS